MDDKTLQELDRAARRAAEDSRNLPPEVRRQSEIERTAVRLRMLRRLDEGEAAARQAMAHHRYKG